MKLLKSERAYKRWSNNVNKGQPQAPISAPVEYPCFAYLRTMSFSYEEEEAEFLYADDLERMSKQLKGTKCRDIS